MIKITLLLLVLLFQRLLLLNGQECNFQNMPLVGTNPALPRTFEINVEINVVNENRTVNQKWMFDGPNRKAAIDITEKDTIRKLIFNYETNEVYEIIALKNKPDGLLEPSDGKPLYPSNCTTTDLKSFTPNDFVDFGAVGIVTNLMPFQDTNQIFNFYPQVNICFLMHVNS